MSCFLILAFLQDFDIIQRNAVVIKKKDHNIGIKFSGHLLSYMMISKNGSSLKYNGVYVNLCLPISALLLFIEDTFRNTCRGQKVHCSTLWFVYKEFGEVLA